MNNSLASFPIWLLFVRFLSTIHLSYNSITIPGLVRRLQRIESPLFVVTSNSNSKSSTALLYTPAILKTLNMAHNQITTMDLASLDTETQQYVYLLLYFFQMDLTGNDLVCDCHMYSLCKHFYPVATGTDRDYTKICIHYSNLHNIHCNSPASVSGKPIVEVDADTFECYVEVPDRPDSCQYWERSVDKAVVVYCCRRKLTAFPEMIPVLAWKLDFSENHLSELRSPLPQYISSLQGINLSSNHLAWIDARVIGELCRNCTLDLHDNALTQLPKEENKFIM